MFFILRLLTRGFLPLTQQSISPVTESETLDEQTHDLETTNDNNNSNTNIFIPTNFD